MHWLASLVNLIRLEIPDKNQSISKGTKEVQKKIFVNYSTN